MPTFWCVNFDIENCVLEHGLDESLWLMQYQYSHDGHTYQGEKGKAATSRNWNTLRGINPGDWLVAYLPKNRFYAIGEVIEPRLRERHRGQSHQEDTIKRTVLEHKHRFLSGVIRYTDATVLYEDFTDPWNRIVTNSNSRQLEDWRYPQRVDVNDWKHVVRSGVEVEGLAKAVKFPLYRDAAFQIPETFFEKIRIKLQQSSGTTDFSLPEEVAADQTGEQFVEGAIRTVLVNAYERNPAARRTCIKAHGTSCCVCGFSFGAVYGPMVEGYIHVHHLRSLSEIGCEYVVDPVEDLRPVCPNCHAVLHNRCPAYSIEEVRALFQQGG